MRKKNGKKKFNNFKKAIRDFIKDEDGFVSKENILKIGLGTISALGILGSLSNIYAGHTNHNSHSNTLPQPTWHQVNDFCWGLRASDHVSHPSHTAHNSY